jgi:hypothetical protein
VFSNPPFAGPDENQHYLRTLSVEQGHLVGPKASPETVTGGTERQREWLLQAARDVEVPARLVPPDAGCYVFGRDFSAACIDEFVGPTEPVLSTTTVGIYQPLPYLLPAVATKAADTPQNALRLGRLAGALLTLGLLALAAAVAWDARAPGLSLLGLALAVTPMVIFCAAILNGSSLEITGGVAFIACLLRLGRDAAPPGWVWIGVGVSGLVFALSRSATPLWIVLAVLVLLVLHGHRQMWSRLRAGGRPAAIAITCLVAGLVLNRVWEGLYGPDVPTGLTAARLGLETGLEQLPFWLQEMVGKFGYLEFDLPLPVYLFWGFATLAAVGGAIRWAPARSKAVLAVCAVALAALPLAQYVVFQRHTGFGLQGRHVLPILVIVPLLAGELLRQGRDRLPANWARGVVAVAFMGVAIAQFAALYWNAWRSAVGLDGPFVFLGDAEWSPPIGWGLWLALAAVGAACVATAGLLAAKAEAAQEEERGLAEAPAAGQ